MSFIVIGAQKAGTTSLFEYVRRHPDVYMPPEKEIGFFSSDANYARGVDWYRALALEEAPRDAVCGEASVAYMCGTPDQRLNGNDLLARPPAEASDRRTEDVIPQRIHRHLPDVKLICVLRDPVARCLSHYRMSVLAGVESRIFEQAVGEMLEPQTLTHDRRCVTGSNGYIVRGEYFRILSGYWRTFPADQIMVIFSSDLSERPREVLSRVYDFIGVRSDFVPENLGVRYREAAIARRVSGLDLYALQQRLGRGRTSRAVWRMLPAQARVRVDRAYERASFRMEMWNAHRGHMREEMLGEVRARLIAHFEPDSTMLASALGVEVPWLVSWRRTVTE